jgi:hypothetical protein
MNSTQSDFHSLTARIEKLETQNRRWKLMNALLLLSGVSVVLMGAKTADRIEPPAIRASTVEAHEFILKDETGRVYARLTLNPPIFAMKQQKGRNYLIPSQVIPGQAALQFYNDKGEVLWTAPTSPILVPVK